MNRLPSSTPRQLTATLALLFSLAPPTGALADAGHDHGGAPPAAAANGPQRLADGSVFLPKPSQRQLAVRTVVTTLAALPRSIELDGRVVSDPQSGGKVQALVAGRIESGPRGLPEPGQAVRKGEVLAWVQPAAAPLERAAQAAQLAELRAAGTLAEKRLARLRELADTVPRKEIEALESEVAAARERAGAIGTGLSGRDALVAPASGVIASSSVVAGQVVDARELVFEIVDPARLRIEALAYDPALISDIGGASLAVGGTQVPLQFVGAARALRDQALPLAFRAQGAALSTLAVGQPVRLQVHSRSTHETIAVPRAALMRNAANETIVWVKTAPERFAPRTVTTAPLDGLRVALTSGVAPGERVVIDGATLINQIR
ncbi:multidrug efflux pump subunit AcrA (membrane-fusion protein) [Pseudacidovorax intermedius]|uniref:Multidrug efflux pump subunit AcrA (Membrane-fusion protein) n=1 Tax=Pseudacidovorax intermedius TaxID=433924 RepID=A0A370F4D2_9BURK|nr:HlyD family efflux transporter periplasmic adaptor subunit [Pseudacidovorax intermedius]RDI18129.1 multidrug efflux pump subunit AcrA (membrane-fusion protein) [Pseudacidovorax intermedius]